MAGNNYRLLLQAQLDSKAIEAQLKLLTNKSSFLLKAKFDESDMNKFEQKLQEISAKASSISKITMLGDTNGGINRAVVEYKDHLQNVTTEYIKINENVAITQRHTRNLAKDEQDVLRLKQEQMKITAREADEMDRISRGAQRFLARSQNMAGSPRLAAAQSTAQAIGVAVSQDDIAKVRELNRQFEIQKAALTGARAGLDSWSEGMARALKQTVQYGLSIGLIHGAFSQLSEGIEYIKRLNEEMIKIQVLQTEGARTNEEIADLALRYNELAKELGATTVEVAQGSVEWLRQGKSIAETSELLEATIMLSKLGALESADATEKLTSTLNGFQMESSRATEVVSKLVQLDNMAATSTQELATAMQYGSAIANQTGVQFEELAAYITTVSSTTRLSAEVIGQAFKTIFTRMEQVKAGDIDETGMSLNNVEKSLTRVGIALRDSADSFRPLGDVIDDIGAKWQTFSELEQAQIANAIAGVRQAQVFLSLMQNYGDVEGYIEAQADSAGLAQERYAIWLEGVEAAQNRMKASAEGMWQATINSSAIKFFYDASAAVFELVKNMGGLQNVLALVAVAFGLYNAQAVIAGMTMASLNVQSAISFFTLLVAQLKNGTAAMWLFNAAAAANPLGVVAVAVGVLVTAFVALNAIIETNTEKIQRLSEEYDTLKGQFKETKSNLDQMKELATRFEELRRNSNRTNEEQKEFFAIQEQIREIMPTVSGYYDEQGNFIVDESLAVGDLVTELENLRNQQLLLMQDKAKERIQAQTAEYEKQTEALRYLIEEQERQQANGAASSGLAQYDSTVVTNDDIEEQKDRITEVTNQIKSDFFSLTKEQQALQLNVIRGLGAWGEEIARELEEAMRKASATAPNTTGTKPFVEAVTGESQDALEKLHELVMDMIKQRKKEEKEAIEEQIRDLKKLLDSQKDYYKELHEEEKRLREERKIALQREHEDAQRQREEQEESVRNELDTYNQILDTQLAILDAERERSKFKDEQASKQDELARLEAQILELSYDTSEEGVARRLEMENEANALRKEMAQELSDEEYRMQVEAIENERTLAEQRAETQQTEIQRAQEQYDFEYELRMRELEDEQRASDLAYEIQVRELEREYQTQEDALQERIKQIEKYLDQEGTISNDAMALLADRNSTVYQDLINWNELYGTGVREDIVSAWEAAAAALDAYRQSLESIPDSPPSTSTTDPRMDDYAFRHPEDRPSSATNTNPFSGVTGSVGTHHAGAAAGFVGNENRLESNELFARLLKGELVVNSGDMQRFMTRTLPDIADAGAKVPEAGDISIMPITINGTLDKTVLPDLEQLADKVLKQINKVMISRGYNRRADNFGI